MESTTLKSCDTNLKNHTYKVDHYDGKMENWGMCVMEWTLGELVKGG